MKHFPVRLLTLCALAFLAIAPHARATDLSITTTAFRASAKAKTEIGVAGAAITIGQLLYLDSTTNTWKLADANASATTSVAAAIAASTAPSGQPVIIVTEDPDLTPGATLSLSAPVYVCSATAGGIAPSADIAAGWYPGVVLIAKTTTTCTFKAGALRGSQVAVAP